MEGKMKQTTTRRDEPEITVQPGPFTLVNQAEDIIREEKAQGITDKPAENG
jgi:hypothetical protein